jgi:ATP/ADP translocase
MGEEKTVSPAKSLFLSKLFLPFVLMLSLMGIAAAALQQSGNLLIFAQLGKNIAPIVKLTCAFPAMLLIIAFIFFLRKTPVQSWIFYSLISFFFILAVIAAWLIPNIGKPPSNKLATAIEFLISDDVGLGLGEAIRQWRLSLILLVIKFLSPALFSVIVWTFINQVTLASESIKYYIPMAFLSGLPAFFLFSTHFFSSVVNNTPLDHARFLMIGAAISVLLAIFIFRWACQSIPEERWMPSKKEGTDLQITPPIFSLAIVLASFGLIKALFNVSFKAQVQTMILPGTDYTILMKKFLTTGNIGSVIVGAFCFFGGPWLLKRLGWCQTALISPLLVLGSVLLFVFGIPFDLSLLTLGKIHEILLKGLNIGLLMPVIQIVYLSIPKALRFRTKGWAELVVAPIFISLGNGVIESLALLRKSAAIVPYFGILSILTLAIMSLALYKLSLRRSMDRISLDE